MTILCDDAGWGSIIGGVLIAAYRPETTEFHVSEVPVEQFQGLAFARKDYLDGAVTAALASLEALHADQRDPITICSGFIHEKTRALLTSYGRSVTVAKITGPFQELIEKELLAYLNRLGFPYRGSTEDYGKLFWESVKWLKGGNPNRCGMVPERVKLAKTGWETFQFYQEHPYAEAARLAKAFKARKKRERFANAF